MHACINMMGQGWRFSKTVRDMNRINTGSIIQICGGDPCLCMWHLSWPWSLLSGFFHPQMHTHHVHFLLHTNHLHQPLAWWGLWPIQSWQNLPTTTISASNGQQKSIVNENIHIHFPPLIKGVLDRILTDEFIIVFINGCLDRWFCPKIGSQWDSQHTKILPYSGRERGKEKSEVTVFSKMEQQFCKLKKHHQCTCILPCMEQTAHPALQRNFLIFVSKNWRTAGRTSRRVWLEKKVDYSVIINSMATSLQSHPPRCYSTIELWFLIERHEVCLHCFCYSFNRNNLLCKILVPQSIAV